MLLKLKTIGDEVIYINPKYVISIVKRTDSELYPTAKSFIALVDGGMYTELNTEEVMRFIDPFCT